MVQVQRNDPCPCGSGRKFKQCHGSSHPAPRPPAAPDPGGRQLENPFRRIFTPDGAVNHDYIVNRLRHLDGLLRKNWDFVPVRYDRDRLEALLAENEQIFRDSEGERFEEAFRTFSALALPVLVTAEFDQRAKEVFQKALDNPDLTRRDRAAAACGVILTLPETGAPSHPLHENPLFDLVLRITFNESLARADKVRELEGQEGITDLEKEVLLQEFFRSMPALLYEVQEAYQAVIRKAIRSYERGDYSFGIGVDMILHGLRAARQIVMEYQEGEAEGHTDDEDRALAQRYGEAIHENFAEDIGEIEEAEIFLRMVNFLEAAREAGAKKAARGLSSALDLMEQNPEIRRRLLLSAYHEAVTGDRLFREETEEQTALALFADPFDVEPYLAYGDHLERSDQPTRAERVYRSAMEFFPEDEEVRERLAAVALALEPERVEIAREEARTIREEETIEDDADSDEED